MPSYVTFSGRIYEVIVEFFFKQTSFKLKQKGKLQKDNLLVFPLKEEYHQTNFNLSILRGNDLESARILLSADFVDVQLAIVDLSEEVRLFSGSLQASPSASNTV